jgi:hypothetical protein
LLIQHVAHVLQSGMVQMVTFLICFSSVGADVNERLQFAMEEDDSPMRKQSESAASNSLSTSQ